MSVVEVGASAKLNICTTLVILPILCRCVRSNGNWSSRQGRRLYPGSKVEPDKGGESRSGVWGRP